MADPLEALARSDWRLLDHGPCEPAWSMAVDEALLEARAPGDPPLLRVYRWSPAAVSLGRFQPAASVTVPPGAALVRRVTGGAAIHHRSDEVTYAVVAPFALFGGRSPRTAYLALHALIAAALRGLGVPLEPRRSPAAPAARVGLCYEQATDYDLVAGERKLVGSAQRRRGDAFLQHGSIPLSPDPAARGAVSLAELLPTGPPEPEAVVRALVRALEERAAAVVPGPLRPLEVERAHELYAARYSNPAWTFER